MYADGSWLAPSNEIRLYANDMQRSCTEYETRTRIETTEATGIYSFVFISYMCEYEFNTFGATRVEISLMSLHLNPVVIGIRLVAWLRKIDEISIITNDL